MADMGNEPDEEQQMAHMLVCSNMFDVEGLVAVTGKYLRPEDANPYRRAPHPELFIKLIDAYAQVVDNLRKHASGWPDPDHLRSIVTVGQRGYGLADVSVGNSSPGSTLLVEAVTRSDPRPVWIVANAGSNTLAQALVDYRSQCSPAEVNAFVAKLRVFENGAQDNAGAWICSEFPSIHWIRSNYQTYAYGGPGGMDGDVFSNLGPHFWQPHEYSVEGQNEWLKEHVMKNHGALGEVYPERRFGDPVRGKLAFMEGGGTIPWMGLVNRGLFDIDHPSWGGWGGRFMLARWPASGHDTVTSAWMKKRLRLSTPIGRSAISGRIRRPARPSAVIMSRSGDGERPCTTTSSVEWTGASSPTSRPIIIRSPRSAAIRATALSTCMPLLAKPSNWTPPPPATRTGTLWR